VDRAADAETIGCASDATFEATAFHRFFSGTIPPAIHINPGDTLRATTVDAGGRAAGRPAIERR
jgi:hypothetical protein